MTESLACFVCEHVFNGHPVLVVSHVDGDWQFLCGSTHGGSRPRIIAIEHLVNADPNIQGVLDLPVDWVARRKDVASEWVRESSWSDSDEDEDSLDPDVGAGRQSEVAQPRPIEELVRLAKEQTSAFTKQIGIGTEDRWSLNLEEGRLRLEWNDGRSATLMIQAIGTYGTRDQTFAWAWEHPTIPHTLAIHALLARSWGEANHDRRFVRALVHCDGPDLMEICAVTCAVSEALGVGHRPSGHAIICFTYVGVA